MTFLSPDTRRRIAFSVATMLAMPELLAAVEAEVAAVFQENPALPMTEQSRRLVWAMALPQLSISEPEQKHLAA